MRLLIIVTSAILLSACQTLPPPICTGTALIGGQEIGVDIFSVRKVANQTQYRAGPPFDWRWVSKNSFTKTTCNK
ncbi:phage exclusion lipoprotein Cor [Serratia fonticola]|uniref:phage exclusion lipoprotein Cor n=1 Tax=Serratia fonticola TaxID=47917 RepID=UPI0021BAB7B5|nr:cor protein [Serratia fonticola]